MFKMRVMGVGNICRSHIKKKTSLAQSAQAWMHAHASTLWPTTMVFSALNQWLDKNFAADEDEILLGDGLLRSLDQVEAIIKLCRERGITSIVIVEIETSEKELFGREASREKRVGDLPLAERLQDHHDHGVPALREMLAQRAVPVQHFIVSGETMLKDATAFARSIGTIYKMKRRLSRKAA